MYKDGFERLRRYLYAMEVKYEICDSMIAKNSLIRIFTPDGAMFASAVPDVNNSWKVHVMNEGNFLIVTGDDPSKGESVFPEELMRMVAIVYSKYLD